MRLSYVHTCLPRCPSAVSHARGSRCFSVFVAFFVWVLSIVLVPPFSFFQRRCILIVNCIPFLLALPQVAAANAMTVLCRSGHSFAGMDLSRITVR